MKVPSRPIRNAAAAPISSGLPTRPAAEALIIRWYASPAGELSSSKASGVLMMPGLIELRRAPRAPHWTGRLHSHDVGPLGQCVRGSGVSDYVGLQERQGGQLVSRCC